MFMAASWLSKGVGTEVPRIVSQFVHNVLCKVPLRADRSPGMLVINRSRTFSSSKRSDRYITTRAVLWGTQIPDDVDTDGTRNVASLATHPPDAAASPRIFYWILSSILLSSDIKIKYLLLLIWLYNSFIEFWPSQPTLSIFFYLGQGSSSLVLSSSVYLF